MHVEVTDDPQKALRETLSFLRTDPVGHNLVLTLLHGRIAQPVPGQYAWVTDGDEVLGVLFRSPLEFPQPTLTPVRADAVGPFVERLAEEAADLKGVMAEAAT